MKKRYLATATSMAIMCSYKDRWAATVGELLKCSTEPTYASTKYAVAMIKEEMTVSHH